MRQLKISKSITNRESASLERYLSEISKEGMINSEEEASLARLIHEGDHEALDKLTRSNLRFVVSVSKQYQNQGLSLPDLINEGNLGLIKAAKRFDETKGFKFISYAVWWIRQSLMQAIAEQSRIIRLPLNKVGSISHINKAFSQLEQLFEREPSNEELSEITEISIHKISDALRVSRRHVSMDAPFVNGEENTLLDLIEDSESTRADAHLMSDSLKKEIERSLNTLNEREREVVKLFFGIGLTYGLTLEEIGAKFDLTRERVRQIKEKAIRILKYKNRSGLLKSYLCD